MKILMFGDVMGRPGRKALREALPKLTKKYEPDLIIANGENLAHGKGITEKTIKSMFDMGINVITSGNHIFNRREGIELLRGELPILRPANYPPGAPGKGYLIYSVRTKNVLVVNLVGRVFFAEDFDCPFRTLEKIIAEKENQNVDTIIVDAHVEATSEAEALGYYFDGKITACLGTHTHVPTADFRILPKGTAYTTDIGMVGIKDSIIGMKKEPIFEKFLTQIPTRFVLEEEGLCEVNGVFVETEEESKKAKKIEKIYEEVEV
jgi:metallophosphoesterase (TIGR00282 family)